MEPAERHTYQPDVSFDGGDLDCGGGLLLLIRRHIDPMNQGGSAGDPVHGFHRRGGAAGLVPPDQQRAGVVDQGRRTAQLPGEQGPVRGAGAGRGRAGLPPPSASS